MNEIVLVILFLQYTHNYFYFMNEPLGNECGEQYRIAIRL